MIEFCPLIILHSDKYLLPLFFYSIISANKIAINWVLSKHHSILLSPSVRSTPSATGNRRNEKFNPATCLPALSCHPDRWIYFHGHGGMAIHVVCGSVTIETVRLCFFGDIQNSWCWLQRVMWQNPLVMSTFLSHCVAQFFPCTCTSRSSIFGFCC